MLVVVIFLVTRRQRSFADVTSSRVNIPALCGAAAAAATGVGYLFLIERQGPPYDVTRISVVAVLIFAMAVVAGVGSLSRRDQVSRRLLIGASIGLWTLGIVGLFSIGLFLLLAGALSMVGAARVAKVP